MSQYKIVKFDNIKVKKKEFYEAENPVRIFRVDRNNIVLSDVSQTRKDIKVSLDILIRPLPIVLPEMSGNVKTFDEAKLKTLALLRMIC